MGALFALRLPKSAFRAILFCAARKALAALLCHSATIGALVLYELRHHGVLVPPPPKPLGLRLVVRGRSIPLTPKQEEMALAWARKKDTPYVQDEVFVANFLRDFSAELGLDVPLTLEEVDFGPCYAVVEAERAAKKAMTPEERKALSLERRREREALRARYGYAIVNGQRVELGTYMVEPSGIFMGRGQHPLRGRWKEGAQERDITLNMGPNATIEGDWAEIVWQPESLWVARWKDKLSDKLKYIWLSDTAPVKQAREAQKFDQAVALDAHIERVRQEIARALSDDDARRRMIATACYLIDALCLRVGDEKEADEADTVGATTLRPEHVTLHDDGRAEFRFLGKDSVEWHKTIALPPQVTANLRELIAAARPSSAASEGNGGARDLPQIFPDINSSHVNAFLSGILPGLSAKVFRTHHASRAVEDSLRAAKVKAADAEYRKWQAASEANLQAAVLCNHTKQWRGDAEALAQRHHERRAKAEERLARAKRQEQECRAALKALQEEAKAREAAAPDADKAGAVKALYHKRQVAARKRLDAASERRRRAAEALGKLDAQYAVAQQKRTWNLGTSLKSYIDPRVYYRWGQQVDYDVLERYYPTTLRRKYAWVRTADQDEGRQSLDGSIRNCLSSDLAAVRELFAAVNARFAEADLPLTAEEIAGRFLPTLEGGWREAVIALGSEQQVIALVVVGPPWEADGAVYLDLFAVMRPGEEDAELTARLAEEVNRRVGSYAFHHPKSDAELRPRTQAWRRYAPALAASLDLDTA